MLNMALDPEKQNHSVRWQKRQTPKTSVALFLSLSFFVLIWCFVLAFLSGSIAFVSFGIISLAFFISKIFFMGAVKRSISAPIEFQNYGSGKHWSLSVFISIILFCSNAAFITFLIIIDFNFGVNVRYFYHGIALSFFSAVLAFLVWKYQQRSFRKSNFDILKYDSTDSKEYFQFLLIFGFILSAGLWLCENYEYEKHVIDSTIAFSFSAGIAINSLKNLKEAFDQLLDKPVSEEIQFNVIAAVSENINMMCEFHSIHTRKSGGDIFIEIDVIMPHDYTLQQVYDVEKRIHDYLKGKDPEAHPRLYAKPCKTDCYYGSTDNCPIGKIENDNEK